MNVVVEAAGPSKEAEYRREIDARGEAILRSVDELDDSFERRLGRSHADAVMTQVLECLEQAWDLYVLAEAHAGKRLRNASERCSAERRRGDVWRECAAELFRRHFGHDMDTVLGSAEAATAESPDRPTQAELPRGEVDIEALLHEADKWMKG